MSDRSFRLVIYLNGFILGFVLMGFEMLSSRYLNPWFGSGIYTWAAIISVTLFSLMVGYFLGGRLVDRFPSVRLLGFLILLSALSIAIIPLPVNGFSGPMAEWEIVGEVMIVWALDTIGEGPWGVTASAFVLLFVPLTLISCYSPFAVRLLLVSTDTSGRQTGAVYGISTFGNILGTLFTSFWLIPTMGTRAITFGAAAATLACAIWLMTTTDRKT